MSLRSTFSLHEEEEEPVGIGGGRGSWYKGPYEGGEGGGEEVPGEKFLGRLVLLWGGGLLHSTPKWDGVTLSSMTLAMPVSSSAPNSSLAS